MRRWLIDLDRILRGEATRLSSLREHAIELPLGGLSLVILALAMSYGLCMGFYSGFRLDDPSYLQWLASTVKVPALFFLTLAVTFPSLYVFNALVGSRLNLVVVMQLLIASLAVNVAVLASLGPIVAFFSLSTTSYPFMVLLNVVVYALSGALGLAFLLQTLQRLSVARGEQPPIPHSPVSQEPPKPVPHQTDPAVTPPVEEIAGQAAASLEFLREEDASALDRLHGHVLGRHVKTVFLTWMVIFGLVGAQMAWVLRPFIGNPNQPFQWFRPRESNFFEGVWQTLQRLLS